MWVKSLFRQWKPSPKLTVTPNQSLIANNSDQFTAVALLQNDKGVKWCRIKQKTFKGFRPENPEGVTTFMMRTVNSGQTPTVILGPPDGTATVKIISKIRR